MIKYLKASPAEEGNNGNSESDVSPTLLRRLRRNTPFVLCGALLLALLFSYGSLFMSKTSFPKRTDFVAPYTAGRLVIEGHGGSVYDLQVTGRVQRALVFPLRIRHSVLPFLYAPYFALVVAPLGALPYLAAYLAWLFVNCLLFGSVLWGLMTYVPLKGRDGALWWLAGTAFLASFVALIEGQMSMVLLAAIGFCFLLSCPGNGTERGSLNLNWPFLSPSSGSRLGSRFSAYALNHRQELAGVALAFGSIKAPYLLPFLLVFLVRRQWRTLVGFFVATFISFAVPTATFGVSAETGYFHSLQHAAQFGSQIVGYQPKVNHSFAGFAGLLMPSRPARLFTYALDLIALLLLARTALKSVESDIPLGMAAVVSLLIGPHVLIHDLVLLLIPTAVALRHAQRIPHLRRFLAFGYAAFILGFPLVSFLPLQLSVLLMSVLAFLLFRAAGSSPDESRFSHPRAIPGNYSPGALQGAPQEASS